MKYLKKPLYFRFWAKNVQKKHKKSKIKSQFYNLRLIFKPWLHISEKYFKNVENTLSEHQKLRKKIRKFSLKTAEAKKKNKKKTGSNVEKLRKLEPQQKQRVLIKKKSVTLT